MKCLKCNGDTIRHELVDKSCVCERRQMTNNVEIECISLGHEHDEIWFICPNCLTYHLQCPKCENLCRLIGMPGEIKNDNDPDIDGQQYIYIFDDIDKQYVLKPFEGEDIQNIYPENCIKIPETINLYFLDAKNWHPTGIDGSRFSRWICELCHSVIDCCD